ncbi:MAG: MaoC family dehydratase N-terminal domain-containing protein [Geminicoccaceae bacterium]|nr:MaoC family dehydratase N-terminal domain-containing protein [Geminicoccaceae bacterium]
MVDHSAWVGRERVDRYRLDPFPAAALAAALGQERRPGTGEPLPPFWHHLYGHAPVDAARTGRDGHPVRGDFLPPVSLARRMWAGGRLGFEGHLRIGEEVTRRSVVRRIEEKAGRSGPLVFVLVEHLIEGPSGRVVEEHDIVYRDMGKGAPSAAPPAAPSFEPDRSREWTPDEVLLFRYSALTWNSHRIHYDLRYATGVEGYPGLIVHGPLLATFLFEHLREAHEAGRLRRFGFRALQPVFVGETIRAEVKARDGGGNWDLRIARADAGVAMQAWAEFGDDRAKGAA